MNELLNQELAIIQRYLAELSASGQNDSDQKITLNVEAGEVWLANSARKVVLNNFRPGAPKFRTRKLEGLNDAQTYQLVHSKFSSPRSFRPEQAREALKHIFEHLVALGLAAPGDTLEARALRERLDNRQRQKLQSSSPSTQSPKPSTAEERRAMRLSMAAKRLDRQNRIVIEGLANQTLLDTKTFAELLGSQGKNPRQFLAPKRSYRKVFGITHNTRNYFPIFQFVETESGKFELFPDMEKVLSPLYASGMTEWDVFFWFDSPNRMLGGLKPRDLLPLPGRGNDCVSAAEAITQEGAY